MVNGARELDGKVAFVTGGNRGIGREVAARFLAAGARVAITGRDAAALEESAKALGEGARPYVLDVRDRAAVDRVVDTAVSELGGLHFLINNAGASGHTPVDMNDDTLWHEIIDTNVSGVWYCTRAALRHMGLEGGTGGRLVHVSSVLGKFGVPAYSAYCASKHAVIGMTRSQAIELAPRGITVNAVCPGWVDTAMAKEGMTRHAREMGISVEAFRDIALAAVPQKRMLSPDEIARFILFLCTDAAAGITGQALSIDAGQTTF